MKSEFHAVPEDLLVQLRAAIMDMNHHLERCSQQASSEEAEKTVAAAMASFARLIKLLAIEPTPKVRECPICGHTVMRAARLCGYCWAKLDPLP